MIASLEEYMPAAQTTPLGAMDFLIASKRSEIQSLEYFLDMGQLVILLSDLIHVLQRERGGSNLYLGASGHRPTDELTDYTHETDQQIAQLDQMLKRIYPEITGYAGNGRLLNRVASALNSLSNLVQFRASVRAMSVTPPQSTQVYSDTISSLLSIVFETADAAVDPTIARVLVALFNLMHGKELMGQERALGAAGFTAGHFSAESLSRLQYLHDGQQRCFELFREFADSGSSALWQQYHDAPYMQEVEGLRRIAEADSGIQDHHGDDWFRLLTQHIDNLKMVELGLQSHLQRLCEQRVSEAREALTQQQYLLSTLPLPADDNYIVMLSPAQSTKSAAGLQDYSHPDGLGPKLGRSVFELVQNQAHSLQQMHDELAAARRAIEEKKLQDKAKVLLMKSKRLTEDQAYKLLRQMAMDQGKRLTDIAQMIVQAQTK
jgi:hypothetical protein